MARLEPKTLTRRRCTSVARLAPRDPNAMSRRALIIGTSRYRCRPFSYLPSVEFDLRELHGVLTAPELGGFEAPSPLCDQPAFLLAIELEAFFRERERADLLLLYLAGHVLVDERGAPFLITHGTDRGRWRSSVIDFAFLRDVMDDCGAEQQVILVDGVFGTFGSSGPSLGAAVDVEAALGGRRRAVLSASSNIRFRLDDGGFAGDASATPLSRRIIQGLRTGEADVDSDGRVSLDDLAAHVRDHRAGPVPLETSHAEFGARGPVFIASRTNAAACAPTPPCTSSMRASELCGASTPELRKATLGRARPTGGWNWASHAASSVASWLAEHVGR